MHRWNPKWTLQIACSSNRNIDQLSSSFNGWSDRIMNVNVDYSEQELSQWCVGVTAIVRVILKDGSYHENIGFAEAKNLSRGAAIQEAKTVILSSKPVMNLESCHACSPAIPSSVRNLLFCSLQYVFRRNVCLSNQG